MNNQKNKELTDKIEKLSTDCPQRLERKIMTMLLAIIFSAIFVVVSILYFIFIECTS